jgi:hypothetical protein
MSLKRYHLPLVLLTQHSWQKTMEQRSEERNLGVVIVRYHCGGWSEELNSRILHLAYMVYL